MSRFSGERRTTLAIWALALLAGVLIDGLRLSVPLDHAVIDSQTRWLRHGIRTDTTIVEIDGRSIQELSHWPWPRRYHAQVIDALVARGARRIFLDVDFSSQSNAQDDAELERAIESAKGRVVLPTFWRPTHAGSSVLVRTDPLPNLEQHATLGLVNLMPDTSGLVREIRPLVPEASAAVAPVAYILAEEPAAGGYALIDYRIAPSSFRMLSFADVLRSQPGVRDLEGKTVLIGATASELNDMISVPVYDALPGVIVQALALESIRREGVREISSLAKSALIGLWAAVATLLVHRRRWERAPFFAATLMVLTLLFTAGAHAFADLLIGPTALLITTAVVLLSTLLTSLSAESWKAWSNWLRFKRQDALLAEIVTHSADAIITLDSDGRIRMANPAATALFGLSLPELESSTIGRLLPQGEKLAQEQKPGRAGAIEIAVTRADGLHIPVELVVGRIAVAEEQVTALTLRDITAQKTREHELRFHATHDGLTGLPNRVYLAERLREILRPGQAYEAHWALVLMDLDGFKEVNDTLGHSVGDIVLIEVAKRLLAQVPQGTCVARLGGDEFAVLIEVPADGTELTTRCAELLLVAAEPVVVKSVPVSLGVSAGVARCPEDAETAETLLQRADIALYAAKRKRTNLEFYDASIDHSSPRRLEMLTLLRNAVNNGEMSLHYQPKVTLATGQCSSVEALARWESGVLGQVAPSEFIALAEATDLITPLTHWTLRRALEQCSRWQSAGLPVQVAVNLSARHLQDAQLPRAIQDLLHATHSRPEWLELEITESAIMSDPGRAFRIVHALRELGISISIDDFGTGYSSLAYLQNLNIDRLKIDRSFVMGMDDSDGSRLIVASIISLGHALGLQIVAEGIETETQRQRLAALGCDFGQGYLFSPAMANEALLDWLAQRGRRTLSRLPVSSRSAR